MRVRFQFQIQHIFYPFPNRADDTVIAIETFQHGLFIIGQPPLHPIAMIDRKLRKDLLHVDIMRVIQSRYRYRPPAGIAGSVHQKLRIVYRTVKHRSPWTNNWLTTVRCSDLITVFGDKTLQLRHVPFE